MLNELENLSTRLLFQFDQAVPESDKLLIMFVNGATQWVGKLDRINNTKFSVLIPRQVMQKGRLYFTIERYDEDNVILEKYTPEPSYLYINKSSDISEVVDTKPDVFAELMYRIQRLEDIIFRTKK